MKFNVYMSQDLKCFFGLHKYEVLDDKDEIISHNEVIGRNIISRCTNCGKINVVKVFKNKEIR